MSIPKVAGLETEYGIVLLGTPSSDPFLASRLLLDAYLSPVQPDLASEITAEGEPVTALPSSTRRLFNRRADSSVKPGMLEAHDRMLINGARFYIDHAHPEYSTAECLSARQLVAADKAGERIVAACQRAVNRSGQLPADQQVRVYKNNSDYQGTSYGCHENYLLEARLFDNWLHRKTHQIFRYLLPFLITRPIVCGAGKVGSENGAPPAGYQLSQRADFLETLIGLQTTQQRPIFNTRDEPHADRARYRRLHVIPGDANLAEFSTYLKIGVTQLVLSMLEDGFITIDLTLSDPIEAVHTVSRDLAFSQKLPLESREPLTGLEIQRVYLDLAKQYLTKGGSDEQHEVWTEWADVLQQLPDHWATLATRLDWAIKRRLLDRYLAGQAVTWAEVTAWQPVVDLSVMNEAAPGPNADVLAQAEVLARHSGLDWEQYSKQREVYYGLRRLDLDYHDIRSTPGDEQSGLYYQLQQRGAIERVVDDDEIAALIDEPPPDTRAWLRGHCLRRFCPKISACDWSSLSFRKSERQAPAAATMLHLSDPLEGTAAQLADHWAAIDEPGKLIEYLLSIADDGGQAHG